MFLEWENSGKLQIIRGKFQNSGKFQNNAINDVKQISLNHMIILHNQLLCNLRSQFFKTQTKYHNSNLFSQLTPINGSIVTFKAKNDASKTKH